MLPQTIWDNPADNAFDSDNMLLPRNMEIHEKHEEWLKYLKSYRLQDERTKGQNH